MTAHRLNAGEWGELYAFLRLAGDGRVQVSDAHERRIDGSYLDVLSVIRHETPERTVTYQEERESSGERHIVIRVNGALKKELDAGDFSDTADKILSLVRQGQHAPFPVSEEIAGFLVDVQVEHYKARSQDKSDIFLDISDSRAGIVRKDVGYSIKTKWSKKATLFNTGPGSRSRYRIAGVLNSTKISEINSLVDLRGNADVIGRVRAIENAGCKLEFVDYATPARAGCQAFVENCELINPLLPKVWQEVVYAHFSRGLFSGATTSMQAISDWLVKRNPCDLTRPEVKYPYMLKSFLYASYCGLTASTLWDGRSDVNGGLITVDSKGELLAYNALDSEAFRSYLFDHCCIDYPSTSPKHGNYGYIYEDDGQLMMDFNFQIRFSSY